MTIILRPTQQFDPINSLPLLGALGTALTLSSEYGIGAKVRWPNDVMYLNHKLGGTLAESKFTGNTLQYVMLGLGLNVNFHNRLIVAGAARSTTILDILGSNIDRAKAISNILLEVEQLYEQVRSGEHEKVLGVLKQNESSKDKRLKIQIGNETVNGVFAKFETLTKVRIREDEGRIRSIDTSSVNLVEYLDT